MAAQRDSSGRVPKDEAAYRRDRRAAVLAHHPDHGGSADALIEALEEVADAYGAEEVIVVTITYDHAARRRSYELIAQHVMPEFQGQAAGTLAARDRASSTREKHAQTQLDAVDTMTKRYEQEKAGG